MDPLVEIPCEKWPELRDLFRAQGPDGAQGYILLCMQIAYPQLAEEFAFKVYCPQGILTNGIVATMRQGDYYQVVIRSLGTDTSKIEESLKTSKIINWEKVALPFTNSVAIECLERLKDHLGIRLYYDEKSKAYKHLLDYNSRKFENVVCPKNTYIGLLRPEHIDIVDKSWNYHSENSDKYFQALMKYDLCYVLYSKRAEIEEHKKDNENIQDKSNNVVAEDCNNAKADRENERVLDEPLAWLSVNEQGSLSHLYCSENHRRKGYAELITKYVVNELLSKGLITIAYTVENNLNPQNLFRKLGFKDVGHDYWVFAQKKEW